MRRKAQLESNANCVATEKGYTQVCDVL